MDPDHDTDEIALPQKREKTDPLFPPPSNPAPLHSTPSNPGLASTEAQPPSGPAAPVVELAVPAAEAPPVSQPVSPEEDRLSAKVRAAVAAHDADALIPRVSSAPPPRAESIDELLDGLAGDGHLPKKGALKRRDADRLAELDASARARDDAARDEALIAAAGEDPPVRKSAPPRSPAPKTATPEDLPSVLLRSDVTSVAAQRASDTILTETTQEARRGRAGTIIAAIVGMAAAIALLGFIRSVTRTPGDEMPARSAIAPTTSTLSAPLVLSPPSTSPVAPTVMTATVGVEIPPPPEPQAMPVPSVSTAPEAKTPPRVATSASPRASAAASAAASHRVEPRTGAAAPLASPPVTPPTSKSGPVDDEFRKTLRQ